MKLYILSAFFLTVLLSAPNFSIASCMAKRSVKKEAEASALIFIGRATKITPARIAEGRRASGKNLKWEKYFRNTDLVTFTVIEAFKGVSTETIEIPTSAEGDAGYKFEGGTWLREGQTYLIYASKIIPAGTVDEDLKDDNYSAAVRAEFRKIQKSFPKNLAAEINEFNARFSPYYASVCGRTNNIEQAAEDLPQLREMFPEAKKFNGSTILIENAPPVSLWQQIINFFGLA
ncbi:MAG TPA: hypothetical protein VF721_14585 [Pyrinomonadaceae bacterium]